MNHSLGRGPGRKRLLLTMNGKIELTSLKFCFLATFAIRMAVHGLSCSDANVSGSRQWKLAEIEPNIWDRHRNMSSHSDSLSKSLGSRCRQALFLEVERQAVYMC